MKHNADERKKHLEDLLRHVRFPMLGRKFLMDEVASEELVINHPQCRRYLYDALNYHLLPERRKIKSNREDEYANHSERRSLSNSIYVIGGESKYLDHLGSLGITHYLDSTWAR